MLRILTALIAVVFLSGAAMIHVPSQPPAKSQGSQADGQANKDQLKSNQQGTNQFPFVVILKPSPDRESERIKDEKDRKQQAITEQNLADYTRYSVFATAVLAIIAALQAFFFVIGLAQTSKAASAAEAVGNKQLNLVGLQADIAEKSKEIERLKYFSEYRPQLEVRFVKRLPYSERMPPDNQPTRVEFVITNSGEECTTTGSRVLLAWLEKSDIPLPPDLFGSNSVPLRKFLRGATDKVTVETDSLGGLIEDFVRTGNMDYPKQLYLLGWVVYVDARGEEFGATRTTYFGRRFDIENEKFETPTDLTDWNFTL